MPLKNKGAILVISLILLIVLSGLVIAGMNLGVTSFRVSRNYSGYLAAKLRSTTMAAYAYRVITSFPGGKFPGPGTCTSTATCNLVDNTFPRNGRPILPWASGLGSPTMVGSSESRAWWQQHGYNLNDLFADNGTYSVVVSVTGSSNAFPFYTSNYKIVGYSTDHNGNGASTYQLFSSWNGYIPDPYPTTTGTNAYTSSGCTGGCPYGQCCSGGVCSANQATCEAASRTFVPMGWTCTEYFVTGLGYNSSTCNNPYAGISNSLVSLTEATRLLAASRQQNGVWPLPFVFNNISFANNSGYLFNLNNIYSLRFTMTNTAHAGIVISPALTGLTGIPGYSPPTGLGAYQEGSRSIFRTAITVDGSGIFRFMCGTYVPAGDTYAVPFDYLPPYCTCTQLADVFNNPTDCN